MSFTPLPTSFIDHLSRLDADTDTVLELGSGEGRFSRRIAELAGGCLRLERRHPATGVVCDLVGDARFPPVRVGSVAVVVAANLVRHLAPRHRLGDWIAMWRRLLRPGGALFVLEDDPDPAVAAERNFRDLQTFLARLLPESRGSLLSWDRFRQLVGAEVGANGWTFGHDQNRELIDAAAVVRLIDGGRGRLTGAEAALSRAISAEGITPGRYWWACVGPLTSEVDK